MPKKKKKKEIEEAVGWIKWIPLGIIFLLVLLFYVTGTYHYFSFHMLKEKHDLLKKFVADHPLLSPCIFMVGYIIATGVSLPVADVLGILGGFLFPFPWNMIYVVIGATGGACIIFLAARTAVHDFLQKKAAPFFKKMEEGFRKDAWSYLLFLRFIPVFPFWLVNLVAAFFSVTFFTFLWTTIVGIIPLTYVHVEIGAGLEKIFDKKDHFTFESLFNPNIRIALILLGVFALLPLVAKKVIQERKKRK